MLYGNKTWGPLITLNCSGSAAMTMHVKDAMCEDWCQWVWPNWRWPIYMREDNDSNVLGMITLLIWIIWTLMLKTLLQTHLICSTCNAMSQLWSTDMWCQQGPCQLTKYHADDAAWWAGELGTLYQHLRWHGHVEHGDGWLKKSRNSIPEEVMAMATLRKPGLKRPI